MHIVLKHILICYIKVTPCNIHIFKDKDISLSYNIVNYTIVHAYIFINILELLNLI